MTWKQVEEMRVLAPLLADAMAIAETWSAIAESAVGALGAVLDDAEAYRLSEATRARIALALREYLDGCER
jgi:hypothetical protein